jgi:hypothetical protein
MRPGSIIRHSDLLFSVVLCDKRTKVGSKIRKGKMTGAVGLAGAFVAGVVLATALVGGGWLWRGRRRWRRRCRDSKLP